MRSCKPRTAALAIFALACATQTQAQGPYGIGRAATPAEIAGWNIDVDGNGNNLPPGGGSVSRGHEIFDQQCAACHGATGEGGVGDRLVGGQGTPATPKPTRTLAVCPDLVRLYPARHAAERAGIFE
jgi:mono/diheme cytochrome c family protein